MEAPIDAAVARVSRHRSGGVRLVYDLELDAGSDERALGRSPDAASEIRERAMAAKTSVVARLRELGVRDASVTVRDTTLTIDLDGPPDEGTMQDVKEALSHAARLEFKMVDDEADVFGKITPRDLEKLENTDFSGISIFQERAPSGFDAQGQPNPDLITHYARMALDDERDLDPKTGSASMSKCRARLERWVAMLRVRADRQVGFEEVESPPDHHGASLKEGWRTLVLFKRAEVTGDSIKDANAIEDATTGGSYYVAFTFNAAGAERFEAITAANINRRFAILIDGVVDSAPVIRSKIGGGRAQITMGAGAPEEQRTKARRLAAALKAGALPVKMTLASESRVSL